MSVARAAVRAAVSESTWRRVERGSPGTSVAVMCAMCQAVGLDFVAQTYPGREPRLRDSGQLVLAQAIGRVASPAWSVNLEVPAGDHGQAIDVVLWGADEILAIEIERVIVDAQAQLRRATTKRDWLAAQHRRPVRSVIVLEDTRRNRAILTPHLPLLRRSFPAGSRQIMEAVRSGRTLGADGMAWLRRPPRS